MKLRNWVVIKYVAVFVFVVWVWETRPVDQQALLFWTAWLVSLVYGSFLFFRSTAKTS